MLVDKYKYGEGQLSNLLRGEEMNLREQEFPSVTPCSRTCQSPQRPATKCPSLYNLGLDISKSTWLTDLSCVPGSGLHDNKVLFGIFIFTLLFF